ncbi:hypothetical protein LCGC14_2058460, partial [marine sediment metagenome]
MKEYPPQKIRNVAIIGHGSTGKTSLAEAMLFASGATNRLGRVEDGTTVSDWDPDEQKRGFSVNLSVVPSEWNGHKLNVVDAPGYADFMGEVKCALRAADLALIVVCGASGIQVGSEFAWQFADELSLPRAVFINRMDRENADFNGTLEQLRSNWGQKCVPLQIPIGSQQALKGVVDLLTMKAYVGDKGEQQDVPPELADEAKAQREKLVEAAAETDDALIEKYLGGEELTQEELAKGIRAGIMAGSIVPVLTGSATKVFGVQALMEAIGAMFPSPADLPVKTDGDAVKADPSGPLVSLVFKTAADPYVGRLTYFRVLSGTFKADSQAWNANRKTAERIGPVYRISGKSQEQVSQVTAGDIGAVAKLTATKTGDTLCSKEKPVTLPPISFPEPAFSAAVSPKAAKLGRITISAPTSPMPTAVSRRGPGRSPRKGQASRVSIKGSAKKIAIAVATGITEKAVIRQIITVVTSTAEMAISGANMRPFSRWRSSKAAGARNIACVSSRQKATFSGSVTVVSSFTSVSPTGSSSMAATMATSPISTEAAALAGRAAAPVLLELVIRKAPQKTRRARCGPGVQD